MTKTILVDILLGAATVLMLISILGLVVMRDVYQRLHFPAPIVAVSLPLIVAAVWIQTNQFQARIKSLMILAVLFGMNAVVSHATARAYRVRNTGHFELKKSDHDVESVP